MNEVIVTGAAGNLGRLVVETFHKCWKIIAVDHRPLHGFPPGVETVRADARWRGVEEILRKRSTHAVIHLGLKHNPRHDSGCYRYNVVGAQRLREMAAKYGVSRVVFLSSANIYGPDPENSCLLTEEAPLLGAEHYPEIRDLVAVDNLLQSFCYQTPKTQTIIFRPVHIVGQRVRSAAANYLRLERPWVLTGFDPLVQLIHEEDVVAAVGLALKTEHRGVFNLVGPGVAPLSRVLKVLGRRPRSIPSFVAWPALKGAWHLNTTDFPPPELRHVQYNCVVDGATAEAKLGFKPRYSLVQTIRSVESPKWEPMPVSMLPARIRGWRSAL
ncbi:MAG: NAD-dependent epimerase/dehydratase family protein [Myxococcales bacterium]|nr:NAD-dependent epimerase/dehydratase family protein [Myxococcales bacterium]